MIYHTRLFHAARFPFHLPTAFELELKPADLVSLNTLEVIELVWFPLRENKFEIIFINKMIMKSVAILAWHF